MGTLKLDGVLLLLRLSFGGLMAFAHGWPKFSSFSERALSFPDPLSLGTVAGVIGLSASELSLAGAVGAELFCAVLLMLGLFTRMALLPLILTMSVAVFGIHGGDPFQRQELGLIYLIIFIIIFWAGSGRYSLGRLSRRKWLH